METWTANFIKIALSISIVCWWVTGLFWFRRTRFILRLPIAITLSLLAMTALGAIVALVIHSTAAPLTKILRAIGNDPVGGIAYFTEVGFETGALWLPVMIIRLVQLSIQSMRSARRERTRKSQCA